MARRRIVPEATQYRLEAERAKQALEAERKASRERELANQQAITEALVNVEVAEQRLSHALRVLHSARMSNGWTERMGNILGKAMQDERSY